MKYRLLLVLTSLIWGIAFAFQAVGMKTMGPYTFSGIRFLIATAALLPLMAISKDKIIQGPLSVPAWAAFALPGFFLFLGATLQQVSLQYTTVSKASFLTATYILMVPFLGLFIRQPIRLTHIAGAMIATVGVYFLSITDSFSMEKGDFLVIASAVCFALQIVAISCFAVRISPLWLSCGEFFMSGLLNCLLALFFETPSWQGILAGWIPLLYLGILSTAVGFTLQTLTQKYIPPSEASMIQSLEMVFGGLTGVLIMGDILSSKQIIGILAMTAGVVLSQIKSRVVLDPGKESL